MPWELAGWNLKLVINHTGRVKRDQRRGRPSRLWVEGLISRDLIYKAFLGINKRSESPGLPVRILKVYREVPTGSSQTVPPSLSIPFLSRLHPETAPTVGTVDTIHTLRMGDQGGGFHCLGLALGSTRGHVLSMISSSSQYYNEIKYVTA